MKIRDRFKSDRGAAVTILALALFILLMMVSVFALDFVKNQQLKQDYTTIAQTSAQASLLEQNGVGGLTYKATADALIDEYMMQSRGKTIDGKTNGGQTVDTAGFRKQPCSLKNAKGVEYPQITIYYGRGRDTEMKESKIHTETSIGGQHVAFNPTMEAQMSNQTYTTITAHIVDVSDNYFYGAFGHPCQEYDVVVSSVATKADDYHTAGDE